MKKALFILPACLLIVACTMSNEKPAIDKWKNEILETEQQFAAMVKAEGMDKAFLAFAADDAVLMRNNDLVIGKSAIEKYMENKTSKGLSWKPDYVDVANSGDLGYTYGKYTFLYTDAEGKEAVDKGVFHSVWKRQSDGKWKFVWD